MFSERADVRADLKALRATVLTCTDRSRGTPAESSVCRSGDTVPVDTVPVDTVPVDTVPADTVPVDTVPVDTVPVKVPRSFLQIPFP